MIEKVNNSDKPHLIISPSSNRYPAPLQDACGVVKEMKSDKELVSMRGELFRAHTPIHLDIADLLSQGLVKISPVGRGNVGPGGVIEDYELTEFSLVNQPPDPDLDEATWIIHEALNERAAALGVGIKFKAHRGGKMFAQYDNPAPDGTSGYWMSYDPDKLRVYIHLTDRQVSVYDPSSVDNLVHALEELRVP